MVDKKKTEWIFLYWDEPLDDKEVKPEENKEEDDVY